MAKQVVDTRPLKGFSVGQSNEELRVRDDKSREYFSKNGNYDFTREHLNFEIVNGKVVPVDKTRSIPLRIQENLKARGIADPNEGLDEPKYRTVQDFVFGGSRERMHELAFGSYGLVKLNEGADNSHVQRKPEIEEWAKDIYRFVANRYGEENIACFIVHLDEMNPHIHCAVLPVARVKGKDRISYKKVFAGKDKFEYKMKTIDLHNELAKVNEKWGLDRGDSIAVTGAKHRTTEEYKRELSRDCSFLERKVGELNEDVRLAETRVKGLTTMIENLEKKQMAILAEIENLQKLCDEGKMTKEAMERRTAELKSELENINEKLLDKREKLAEAEDKLDAVKVEISGAEERLDAVKEETKPLEKTVEQKYRSIIEESSRIAMIDDFKVRFNALPDNQKGSFEDSLIAGVADQGENITRVAMMLFIGVVDAATNYADAHGGGGGGSTDDLKRKDDEDDEAWARRCVANAHKLMKPSLVKRKR